MYIQSISLENLRCFFGINKVELSPKINILVGRNNSGKSSIIKSINILQDNQITIDDVTIKQTECKIVLELRTYDEEIRMSDTYLTKMQSLYLVHSISNYSYGGGSVTTTIGENPTYGANRAFEAFDKFEPTNAVIPYLSNRRVVNYSREINATNLKAVDGTLANLYAKVDNLSNSNKPAHSQFTQACIDIIGFPISTEIVEDGKIAAFTVDNDNNIPLPSMGDGVAQMLGLIVSLCTAKNKIFLIEEPENDVHPKSLKALLKLIEMCSEFNQFIISTHSNIVVKYLGANDNTKIFNIASTVADTKSKIPKSTIETINSEESRLKVLEDLGYDTFDYSLWKGWLFLEESSAELIIREFLIKSFTPNLINKLRTHSTRTITEIESKFEDFNNLFVYIHRAQTYMNRAWVVIDAGKIEGEILTKMKSYYLTHGWNDRQFRQLSKHNFEDYYPTRFSEDVDAIKEIDLESGSNRDKKEKKREAKKQLLERVKQWYTDHPEEAKDEFSHSASEVIDLLKEIDEALN